MQQQIYPGTETTMLPGLTRGTQQGNCGGSTCTRWGDYSAMVLDPNGCDFWFTTEYYAPAPDVSQTFAIARASQTIAFAALPNTTYGDPDFTVSATALSGLPASFAAAGNCTVAGSTVHLTSAGSCTITASQGGNANYNAAADVPRSFTIDPAPAGTPLTKLLDGGGTCQVGPAPG